MCLKYSRHKGWNHKSWKHEAWNQKSWKQEVDSSNLRSRSAGIEESGRGVCEPALRHEVVGLDGGFDVSLVDPDTDPHQCSLHGRCIIRVFPNIEWMSTIKEYQKMFDKYVLSLCIALRNLP